MATTKPILHPQTEQALESLIANPPHALLVSGPPGMGKRTVADWMARSVLAISGELEDYPYFLSLQPKDGKAIGIEVVRELEHGISLRIPSRQAIARIVIIYDAHLLTNEAQNALLKTLEEPPADTMIILTSSQTEALLPTVRSRMQTVEVIRPTKDSLLALLIADGVAKTDVAQLQALSGGLPGLAVALARNDRSHPLVQAAQTARKLLQQSSFERLAQVDALAKDREQARYVTYILVQMSHAALLTGRGTDRWQKVHSAAFTAEERLGNGTQAKLVLIDLMLNL